jgi:hypothetical protein
MPDVQEAFGPVYFVASPDFPLHPLCTVFPRASDDDISEMAKITRHLGGIINNPIIVWRDPSRGELEIIDGGNRQHVARLCGCGCEVREFLGDYAQGRTFVKLWNIGRRHLTGTQKAAALLEMSKLDAKYGFSPGNQRESIAKQSGVAEETVRKIQRVAAKAGVDAVRRLIENKTTLREELKIIEEGDPTGKAVEGPRPETPPDVILDDDGTEVPESLIDVWKVRAKFREVRARFKEDLNALRSIIREPGGHGLSVEHDRHVKDLVADLEAKMPSLICCHCRGTGLSASELSKKRWLSMGDEGSVGKCYCCKARGYLLKDEPRPEPEWEMKLAS